MDVRKKVGSTRVADRRLPLSDPELDILVLLSNGCTIRQAASKVHMSLDTAKSHVQVAYFKLGAHSMAQAVALAMRHRILKGWQVSDADVPGEMIQQVNRRWIENINIILDQTICLDLAELQLVDITTNDQRRKLVQLSGWLQEPCADLVGVHRARLSFVSLPGRSCATGQEVQVRLTKFNDEYGLGIFVTLRWSKES